MDGIQYSSGCQRNYFFLLYEIQYSRPLSNRVQLPAPVWCCMMAVDQYTPTKNSKPNMHLHQIQQTDPYSVTDFFFYLIRVTKREYRCSCREY